MDHPFGARTRVHERRNLAHVPCLGEVASQDEVYPTGSVAPLRVVFQPVDVLLTEPYGRQHMFKALFARLRKKKAIANGGVGPASSIKIQSTDINDVLDEDGNLR